MASIPLFTILFLYSTALLGTVMASEIPADRGRSRILDDTTLEKDRSRQGLKVNFYETACPNAEDLVAQEMKQIQAEDATLMPSLIRLHFHDCFVRGCDASILLDSGSGIEEKDATPSLSLRGFGTIERLRSQGPRYDVDTGRRDGSISIANETYTNLPPVNGNISNIIGVSAKKNLTKKDVAVLSGAHSIGVSHCSSFSYRLYNYTGTDNTDPSLNPRYAKKLKQQCSPTDSSTTVPMDPDNPLTFGLNYYKSVLNKEGLFNSDEALLHNKATRAYVAEQASAMSSQQFMNDFAESMVNMGRVNVLTEPVG
ncbi:peroxidase 27-like [Carex rostrata]